MRIVLISYFGLADYTIALANALSSTNDVLLVLAKKSAAPFVESIAPEVTLNLVDFPRLRNPINLIYAYNIYCRIKAFKPHVIHFQGGFIWFSFLLPWLKRYPLVTTIHDDEPHQGDSVSKRMRWFLPNSLAMKFSTRLIVHGDYIKEGLISKSKIAADKITSILPGDGLIYKDHDQNGQCEDRVLFYGRILEYKGLSYLIKAQPLISEAVPNVKICIAGEGHLHQDYQKIFSDKDCFEIYNHYIDRQLTAALFTKSSVVVLPYNAASQSGVIPIAYSFSKPVVATDVGSLPEIVEHNKTGLIIPPRNIKKLAEAIIMLLTEKDKCKKFGKNAYQKISSEMSWKNVAQLTKKVYESTFEIRKAYF